MKRARSEHITLRYRLDQRAHDSPTSSSMLSFMEKLAFFLECPVKTYSSNKTQTVRTGRGIIFNCVCYR